MPNTGLPVNLQALLDTLVGHNTVKSWQIYDDNGNVTVKIRFSHGGHLPTNGQSTVTTSSYIRKPKSKMDRDQKRASTYMENRRITRSQTMKRDYNNCEPERPRNLSDYSGEPSLLDTPIVVDPDIGTCTPSQASDSILINTPGLDMCQLHNPMSETVTQNKNIQSPSDHPCDDTSIQREAEPGIKYDMDEECFSSDSESDSITNLTTSHMNGKSVYSADDLLSRIDGLTNCFRNQVDDIRNSFHNLKTSF